MSVPRAPSQTLRRNRLQPDATESEVALRVRLTNARFHRLLDYCAGVLGESVEATDELSRRVRSLRDAIETRSRGESRRKTGGID